MSDRRLVFISTKFGASVVATVVSETPDELVLTVINGGYTLRIVKVELPSALDTDARSRAVRGYNEAIAWFDEVKLPTYDWD